jgi:hypothetical protein
VRNFVICTHPQIALDKSSQGEYRWMGHVACIREEGKCSRISWESQKEGYHSEDRGVDRRIGLEWILGRFIGAGGLDSSGSG